MAKIYLLGVFFLPLFAIAQVGINTTTPGTTLDVNGAITNRETAVTIAANAASIPANVSQVQLIGSATAPVTITAPSAPNAGQRLIIYNNTGGTFGAVLNGVTIPKGQAIEFAYSNGNWRATNGGTAAANTSWNILGNTGTTPAASFLGTTDNQDMVIRTNNTEKMRVQAGGNIGIGTNTPISKLHLFNGNLLLNGSSAPSINIQSNLAQGIGTNDNNGTINFFEGPNSNNFGMYIRHVNSATGSADNDGNLLQFGEIFSNVYTPYISLQSNSGNVGIGTTIPNNRLDLGTSLGSTINDPAGKKLALYNDATGTDFYGLGISTGILQFHTASTANEAPGMVLTSGGRVGIGITAPTEQLHVIGNILASGSITPSDIRIKKDIVDNNYGLKEILNLRTINYKYKDEKLSKDKKIGFVAQEVKAVIPELVTTANDEMKTLGVNYAEMTVVLTKAVQEQQKKIEALESRIKAMELQNKK